MPAHNDERAPTYLAFIVINAIALPALGIALAAALPADISGAPPAPYRAEGEFVGEGTYEVGAEAFTAAGDWREIVVPGDELAGEDFIGGLTALLTGRPDDLVYAETDADGAAQSIAFNGQNFELTYRLSPDGGVIGLNIDNQPLTDDEGELVTISTYSETIRYGETETIEVAAAGRHELQLVNASAQHAEAQGDVIAISQIEILPPSRKSSLPTIMAIILAFEILALLLARMLRSRFVSLSNWLDTRRSILLALFVYCIVACWGYILNATLEFWMLALMVAMVQGGSQALSRSLYASLCPAAKSGEFFGFYAIMEKFASIIGPLIFAFAGIALGSSRPAILSLILLFALGGYLLSRVNIAEGQRVAREEDAEHGVITH